MLKVFSIAILSIGSRDCQVVIYFYDLLIFSN